MNDQKYIEEILTVTFLSPKILKPTENYDQEFVNQLATSLREERKWKSPIIVEKNSLVIMDGHHRHQAAQLLNITKIPCILLSYENPFVKLSSRIDNFYVTSEDVIQAGLSGSLLGYKVTKHDILIEPCTINIPLEYLITKN